MGNLYALGTFKKNQSDIYEIREPIILTGIECNFLTDLFNASNLDIRKAFSCFSYEQSGPLLFYSICSDWNGPLDSKYSEYYIKPLDIDDIPSEHFPLVCDGEERNYKKYYFTESCIRKPDFSSFSHLYLNLDSTKEIIKDNYLFKNNSDKAILEFLISTYNKVSDWIKEKEQIYLFKYY